MLLASLGQRSAVTAIAVCLVLDSRPQISEVPIGCLALLGLYLFLVG
jgi:hypothetical protein